MSKQKSNILVLLWLITTTLFSCNQFIEHKYCGKIDTMYISNGNIHSDYNIVFYNDSLKRRVHTGISGNRYMNVKKGEYICVDIQDRYMNNY